MGWAEEAASVRDTLSADGLPVVLVKRVQGEFDPATGTAQETTVEYQCFAVLDVPETQDYGAQLKSGSSVTRDDKVAYLDAVAARPAPGDKLLFNGVEWAVMQVQTTEPGGVPVLHRCIIRAA